MVPSEISHHLQCTGTKFGTDIHGTQRINSDDSRNPLSFHLVPPAGWNLWFDVVGWVATKCGRDIYVPLSKNCNDFADPLLTGVLLMSQMQGFFWLWTWKYIIANFHLNCWPKYDWAFAFWATQLCKTDCWQIGELVLLSHLLQRKLRQKH